MGIIKTILQFLGLSKEPAFRERGLQTKPEAKKQPIKPIEQKESLIKSQIEIEPERSKEIIDQKRQEKPDDPEVRFENAHWLLNQNRFSEAADELDNLTAEHPSPQYSLEYARVLFAQEKFEEAEKICHQILSEYPEDRDAILFLAKINLSRITPDEEESDSKGTSLKDVYAKQTESFDHLASLTKSLKKIIEQNPEDQKAIEILTEIYALTNDESNLQGLSRVNTNDFVDGKLKLMNGEFEAAARIFAKLVAEDQSNTHRIQNYALAQEQSGHPNQALKLFHQVLSLNPHSLIAHRHFQHLAVQTNNSQVLEAFEKSIANEKRSSLFALYAEILEELDEFDKALEYYGKAVNLQTKEKKAVHHYARLANNVLPPIKARKVLEKLSKEYPEDQVVIDLYLQRKGEEMNSQWLKHP